MKGRWSAFLLLAVLLCTASYSAGEDKPLKKRIRRADERQYHSIQYIKEWKNPFLVVWPNGVEIDQVSPNHELTKVESIGDALGALPVAAWPLGLVVAVQNAGFSETDRQGVEQTRKKLISALEKLNIAVDLWP